MTSLFDGSVGRASLTTLEVNGSNQVIVKEHTLFVISRQFASK